MRASAVAICTLATLTAQDITQSAIASPVPFSPEPPANSDTIPASVDIPEPISSIAPPETVIDTTEKPALNGDINPANPVINAEPLTVNVVEEPTVEPLEVEESLDSKVQASGIAFPEVVVAPERVVANPAPIEATSRVVEFSHQDSAIAPPETAIAPERSAASPTSEVVLESPMPAYSLPISAASEQAASVLEVAEQTAIEQVNEIAPTSEPDAIVLTAATASTQAEPAPVHHSAALLQRVEDTAIASLNNSSETQVAQAISSPSAEEVEALQQQLEAIDTTPEFGDVFEGSPAITISNPSGFGADNFTGFVHFGFQGETRYGDVSDGSLGVGMGFGDARRNLGVQLSYTIASFGGSREFGTGGFNAKLHRQLTDGLSIAAGWDGFITTGDVDFEDSIYGSITQILRTRDDIDDPFSRIALTAGVGNGRFRSEDAFADDDDTIGVFGSVAVRVARPVSLIAEWTGQDLAVGASVAPFRDIPLVITPALRDVAGAGDGARFVLGVGVSFQL